MKYFFWLCVFLIVAAVNFGPILVHAGTLPSNLTWSNPDTVNGIQIEKAASTAGPFSLLDQIGANSTSYTDATNSAGDTACYRVAYFNASGVGPYAGPVCKSFPTIPTQNPAGLVVK